MLAVTQVKEIEATGGRAVGILLNAIVPGTIEALVERVEQEIGEVRNTI
jgi:hypothetical protein